MSNLLQGLQSAFPLLNFVADAKLAPFSYMKIGGPAEVLWRASNPDDLIAVMEWCKNNKVPVTILGGISNVLISDAGLPGLVVINEMRKQEKISKTNVLKLINRDDISLNDNSQFWLAQTGVRTADLVGETTKAGLGGLEPFLGVPGSLGGALYNNSHYQNELIGTYVAAVEVWSQKIGMLWLSQAECDFKYDHSRFQNSGELLLQAVFALPQTDAKKSEMILREAALKRARTQPLGTANSGCFFRNWEVPADQKNSWPNQASVSAGWLIDQVGAKGWQEGGAIVSDKHANFIVNQGNATADDVLRLAIRVQKAVAEKFGITLHPEVFALGLRKGDYADLFS